jgi:hypothetical protein
MYKLDNGVTVYETLDDLLNADIESVYEDDNNYYFHLVPECYYENAVWVVDKQTSIVSYIMYTEFLCEHMYEEGTRQISPESINRMYYQRVWRTT